MLAGINMEKNNRLFDVCYLDDLLISVKRKMLCNNYFYLYVFKFLKVKVCCF